MPVKHIDYSKLRSSVTTPIEITNPRILSEMKHLQPKKRIFSIPKLNLFKPKNPFARNRAGPIVVPRPRLRPGGGNLSNIKNNIKSLHHLKEYVKKLNLDVDKFIKIIDKRNGSEVIKKMIHKGGHVCSRSRSRSRRTGRSLSNRSRRSSSRRSRRSSSRRSRSRTGRAISKMPYEYNSLAGRLKHRLRSRSTIRSRKPKLGRSIAYSVKNYDDL